MTNLTLNTELAKFEMARNTLIGLFYELNNKQQFSHGTPDYDKLQEQSSFIAKLLRDDYGW